MPPLTRRPRYPSFRITCCIYLKMILCICVWRNFKYKKKNVRLLKNMSEVCVKEPFESVLEEKVSRDLQTDKGTEFKNTPFQGQLTEYKIKFYTSENDDIKAAIVERFNRTLKTRMYRYFTNSKSYGYVDVLQYLVHSYNHTYHSSSGMSPASVNVKNDGVIRQNYFTNTRKNQHCRLTSPTSENQ